MGSFAEFSIDGYPLIESKSYVINEVAALFREADKRLVTRDAGEQEPGAPPPEGDVLGPAVLYQTSAGVVAERLDIIGFTLARAERDFNQLLKAELSELSGLDDLFAGRIVQLSKLTFENYGANLKVVLAEGWRPERYHSDKNPGLNEIETYILTDEDDESLYGFFCSDIRSFIRLASSLVSPAAIVAMDLTELVDAGYYDAADHVASRAVAALTEDYAANAKINRSDRGILGLRHPKRLPLYSLPSPCGPLYLF